MVTKKYFSIIKIVMLKKINTIYLNIIQILKNMRAIEKGFFALVGQPMV